MYRTLIVSMFLFIAQSGIASTSNVKDTTGMSALQSSIPDLGAAKSGGDADAAYYCRDGRFPVQGFCRDYFLGTVTDCFNVIGFGLRSNQCASLGAYAGYQIQILDGRGYTYCDCWGAIY